MYYHKLIPQTFDDMIPWEKEIYVNMLIKRVEEENEKIKLDKAAARSARKRSK